VLGWGKEGARWEGIGRHGLGDSTFGSRTEWHLRIEDQAECNCSFGPRFFVKFGFKMWGACLVACNSWLASDMELTSCSGQVSVHKIHFV
jgi:hypothetical protein